MEKDATVLLVSDDGGNSELGSCGVKGHMEHELDEIVEHALLGKVVSIFNFIPWMQACNFKSTFKMQGFDKVQIYEYDGLRCIIYPEDLGSSYEMAIEMLRRFSSKFPPKLSFINWDEVSFKTSALLYFLRRLLESYGHDGNITTFGCGEFGGVVELSSLIRVLNLGFGALDAKKICSLLSRYSTMEEIYYALMLDPSLCYNMRSRFKLGGIIIDDVALLDIFKVLSYQYSKGDKCFCYGHYNRNRQWCSLMLDKGTPHGDLLSYMKWEFPMDLVPFNKVILAACSQTEHNLVVITPEASEIYYLLEINSKKSWYSEYYRLRSLCCSQHSNCGKQNFYLLPSNSANRFPLCYGLHVNEN